MKKVGLMQPYLFPYLGYFQLLHAVDEYVIYDDVQFIKGGRINRNNILVNGEATRFTVSLKKASPNKLINQIEIHDDFNSFQSMLDKAYHGAPQKEIVSWLIRDICAYEDKNLANFTGNSIKKIADYLGIGTTLLYSSNLNKDNSLQGQDKVIDICEELGAGLYINAIGGQELYDKQTFKKHRIELKFLKPELRQYAQFNNDFIPYLSIIDIMMFNSPAEIREMLNDYELI